MRTPDGRSGPPFDQILRCGPQLENGRTLGDSADLIPIAARIISLLSDATVGKEAVSVANNQFRRLQQLTDRGEPTMLSSPAIVQWQFDGLRAARHSAQQAVGQLALAWATAPDDGGEAAVREQSAANSHHLADVDELMDWVRKDEDGRPLLGEFDKELAKSWRARRPKAREVLSSVQAAEEAFAVRMEEAHQEASRRCQETVTIFVAAVREEAILLVDTKIPPMARLLAEGALGRVGSMEATLLGQRDAIREDLAVGERAASAALQALASALSGSPLARLRGHKRALGRYVEAATNGFRLRFAFNLTEAALAALADGRRALQALVSTIEDQEQALQAVGQRCRRATEAFESRETTPVEEIIERPLYDIPDLHRLYRDTCGSEWGTVSEETAAAVRHALGGLSRLLGQEESVIYEEMLAAALPLFSPISSMTADDFVRWKYRQLDRSPDLLLRDSEVLAPTLCRYDRAKLPEGGDQREASFVIIGVPDRDRSVFSGTPHGLLVSTDDRSHIVVLRLTMGYPPSSLWHYDRYRQAHAEIGQQGRVAQDIYPGFPHELRREWEVADDGDGRAAGKGGQRRKQRRDSRGGSRR